jgi:hypothetical protein
MAFDVPEPVAAYLAAEEAKDADNREFPGSPLELDHIFKLSGDKIASLEIRS